MAILDNAYITAILISVCRLLGSIIGMVMLRKVCGKKSLLMTTSAAMGVAILLLGFNIR